MSRYKYFMPVEIIFGRGCLEGLFSHPLVQKAQKPLLVAGGHLKKEGTVDKLVSQFEREPLVHGPNIPKSSIEAIDSLRDFCQSSQPDLIIAIGGGTIIDTVKAAIFEEKIPLIAIPTTAGTGSEVTPFAVIWDTENKKKLSLASPEIFPKLALVDPRLTDSLPPKITACTGMDALTQAVEAYWSKKHNPVSDIFALKAIRLITAALEKAVNSPDEGSREMMSRGALFSGLAFSNTATTICHAVSYPMTAHFDIPHGQAVALTLPPFLEFSFEAIESERRGPLLKALGASDARRAAEEITALMKKIGLETCLSRLGIEKDNIQLIVNEGFHPDRAGNAPQVPTKEELKEILVDIY